MSPADIFGRFVALIGAALIGGGFAVGYWVRQPGANPWRGQGSIDRHPFNAYVQIGDNGGVIVAVPRAEMGQGVHTALAMLVAIVIPAEGPSFGMAPSGTCT